MKLSPEWLHRTTLLCVGSSSILRSWATFCQKTDSLVRGGWSKHREKEKEEQEEEEEKERKNTSVSKREIAVLDANVLVKLTDLDTRVHTTPSEQNGHSTGNFF